MSKLRWLGSLLLVSLAGTVIAQETAVAPVKQQQFQQAIAAFHQQWSDSQNPLEQFLIRKQRKEYLAKLLPDRQFLEWVGVLTSLRATANGKAYLEITVADPQRVDAQVRPRVGTWNNAYLDLDYGTLVFPGTELYDWLATFRVGEWVRFTGLAFPDDEDHLKEASTEAVDAMGAPLFITKFEYLERVEGPTLPESQPQLAASETVADNASKVEADPDKAEGKKQKADVVGAGHVREPSTDHQPTTDDRRPMTDPQLTVRYYTNHQLSTYDWEYTDYLKRWNEQTRFYWARHPPTEYLSGEHPQGGEVWVTVKVNRDGRIFDTQAQATGELPESVQEVALRAVDTVLLPPLPFGFPDEQLRVTFRFRMAPLTHLHVPPDTSASKIGMSPKTKKRLARRKVLQGARELWHEKLRKAVESSFRPLQRHRPDSELVLELRFSKQAESPTLRLLSRQGSPAFLLGVLEGLAQIRWPPLPELLLNSQPLLHLRVVP
ncbi:MAG: hypothetical protein VX420_00405 [SAR324 cluster bacterium]|nr:hypothetical protein [SAR324 cluster bacterium]